MRAESAVALIEVKSHLKKEHAAETLSKFAEMWQLKRFYKRGFLLRAVPATEEHEEALSNAGIPGNHGYDEIPPIVTCVFAFDGPGTADVTAEYFRLPGVDIVCVLGEYTFVVGNNIYRAKALHGIGDDALSAFCSLLEDRMFAFSEARSLVHPDLRKYYAEGVLPSLSEGKDVE